MTSKRSNTPGRKVLMMALAGALSSLPAMADNPHAGTPQGFQAEGRAQQGERISVTSGSRMPGSELPPGKARPGVEASPGALAAGGQAMSMEEALRQSPPVVRREPSAPATLARGGTQQGARQDAASQGSHLVLVLRVTTDGSAELVSATELAGKVALSPEPKGDFLYEVSDGARTLAVEGLPDPFEAHSYGGRADETSGHHFQAERETTVVVRVPGMSLRDAVEKLDVKLYRLNPGEPSGHLTPERLTELKQGQQLRTLVHLRADALGPQIRGKGIRAQQ
ncbi:hypothetical protein [Vitiosangium sp. GDMCC 1.1324]|uniref:hypothetical protein n=1 Tax=Vitiosangium sp. (strain GDMCC 1.1324) TaxID=2138576 RepID=UPI000D3A921C|nr:hypothetical protein [Vitiosangium sp. GDMCC 1.1324]PTL75163.1 hypothetical protein DAT35_56215 [Vitiosangium sp. GDMCC 1.1324]